MKPEASVPTSPPPAVRIIAVSDDREITSQIAGLLTENPIDFQAFTNPTEALAYTAREHPDLLIVDVGMSSPAGRRLCHLLQSYTVQSLQPPPVLILADSQDEQKHARLIRATGAVALITHPCQPDTLQSQIRFCLDPINRPSPRHLMVVTADEQLAASIESALPARSWKVDPCPKISMATAAFALCPPDVVVMDLEAEGAVEAISLWKHATPEPTIIAVADSDRATPTWKALQAGALEYLPRSQDPATLAHTALTCHFHRLQAEMEAPSPSQAFELQDANSLLDTLLTESAYGQIVLNNRGFPVRWNPAADRLFRTAFNSRIEPYEPPPARHHRATSPPHLHGAGPRTTAGALRPLPRYDYLDRQRRCYSGRQSGLGDPHRLRAQ